MMTRREFIGVLGAAPAVVAAALGHPPSNAAYVFWTRNGDAYVHTGDADLMRSMLAGADTTTTKLGVIWRRDTRHEYERWCDPTPARPSIEALPLHVIAKELRT